MMTKGGILTGRTCLKHQLPARNYFDVGAKKDAEDTANVLGQACHALLYVFVGDNVAQCD